MKKSKIEFQREKSSPQTRKTRKEEMTKQIVVKYCCSNFIPKNEQVDEEWKEMELRIFSHYTVFCLCVKESYQ